MEDIVKKSLIWLFYILSLIIIVNYFCESFCFFETIISNEPIEQKVFYTFDFKIIYFILPMLIGYILSYNQFFYKERKQTIFIGIIFTILFFIPSIILSFNSYYTGKYIVFSCIVELLLLVRLCIFYSFIVKSNFIKLVFESFALLTIVSNFLFNILYINKMINAPFHFYLLKIVFCILLLSVLVFMFADFALTSKLLYKFLLLLTCLGVFLFGYNDFCSALKILIDLFIIKKEISDLSLVGNETIKNLFSFIGLAGLIVTILFEMIRDKISHNKAAMRISQSSCNTV